MLQEGAKRGRQKPQIQAHSEINSQLRNQQKVSLIIFAFNDALLGGRGSLCPRLNFKPFHVAISEGSHVTVRISSSGLSFVVISAPSCRRFRAVSPAVIYPNRASLTSQGACERGESAMVIVRFEYLHSDSEHKLLIGQFNLSRSKLYFSFHAEQLAKNNYELNYEDAR